MSDLFGFQDNTPVNIYQLFPGDIVLHPKDKNKGTIVSSSLNTQNKPNILIYWHGEGIKKASQALLKKLTLYFRGGYSVERFAFYYLLLLIEANEKYDSWTINKVVDAIKVNLGQIPGEVSDIEKFLFDKQTK